MAEIATKSGFRKHNYNDWQFLANKTLLENRQTLWILWLIYHLFMGIATSWPGLYINTFLPRNRGLSGFSTSTLPTYFLVLKEVWTKNRKKKCTYFHWIPITSFSVPFGTNSIVFLSAQKRFSLRNTMIMGL